MSKSKETIEETLKFTPRFNQDGLIPCITISANTGQILMQAFMNEEALKRTIETREAHYWSRSRNELWHKGATSGHIQHINEIRTDCDQDCILLSVEMENETSCHTGQKSCFYRAIDFNALDDANAPYQPLKYVAEALREVDQSD